MLNKNKRDPETFLVIPGLEDSRESEEHQEIYPPPLGPAHWQEILQRRQDRSQEQMNDDELLERMIKIGRVMPLETDREKYEEMKAEYLDLMNQYHALLDARVSGAI